MNTNTIYNENCLITMAKIPNDFVELILTSPPYDSMRDYHNTDFDFKAIAKELPINPSPPVIRMFLPRKK